MIIKSKGVANTPLILTQNTTLPVDLDRKVVVNGSALTITIPNSTVLGLKIVVVPLYNCTIIFTDSVGSNVSHSINAYDNLEIIWNGSYYKIESNVVWATYGSTTFAQITAWRNAGKEILCLSGGEVYRQTGANSTEYYFTCLATDSLSKHVVVNSSDTWSSAQISLQPAISSSNKLSADYVDDTSTTNKFVTSSDKTTWNGKVTSNSAITGATKCKITYDSKGLVTAGADLQASDIPNLATSKITALTGYTKASSAAEIADTDSLNTALGKLQKTLDGKQASGSYVTANTAITGATKCKITYDSKGLVTSGEDLQSSDIPNLATSKITALTSYTKASTAAEISASDSLNTALGKLQKTLDGKEPTITGAATSIVQNNLTASKVLVSNSNGKIAVGSIASDKIVGTDESQILTNKTYRLGATSGNVCTINNTGDIIATTTPVVMRVTWVDGSTPTEYKILPN